MKDGRGLEKPLRLDECAWDKKFTVRQTQAYASLDSSTQQPDERTADSFVNAQRYVLIPPQYNNTALRKFLAKAALGDLIYQPSTRAHTEPVAVIDDRCDSSGWQDIHGMHHSARDWNGYSIYPPQGTNIYSKVLNAHDLYRRLRLSRQANKVERRIIYIQDMTPLCALALATSSSKDQTCVLRDFLQRHVSRSVGLGVFLPLYGYALSFHLPYYALRRSTVTLKDHRGLRRCGLLPTSACKFNMPEYLYEAQISLLVTGVDEWYWTAYCCTEVYFSSEEKMQYYHDHGLDAPSGGERPAHSPVWNPREYFLFILSRRFRQVTKEYQNLVVALEERLELQEASIFEGRSSQAGLFDDAQFTRTRECTTIINLLRLLLNGLMRLIECWESFEASDLQYFRVEEQDEALRKIWQVYLAEIKHNVKRLHTLRRPLQQKIETFDNMRAGLVSASAMMQSRIVHDSAAQGRDIARLTRMTVLYLPLSFATTFFSMTILPPDVSWTEYVGMLIGLTFVTMAVVFGWKNTKRTFAWMLAIYQRHRI